MELIISSSPLLEEELSLNLYLYSVDCSLRKGCLLMAAIIPDNLNELVTFLCNCYKKLHETFCLILPSSRGDCISNQMIVHVSYVCIPLLFLLQPPAIGNRCTESMSVAKTTSCSLRLNSGSKIHIYMGTLQQLLWSQRPFQQDASWVAAKDSWFWKAFRDDLIFLTLNPKEGLEALSTWAAKAVKCNSFPITLFLLN